MESRSWPRCVSFDGLRSARDVRPCGIEISTFEREFCGSTGSRDRELPVGSSTRHPSAEVFERRCTEIEVVAKQGKPSAQRQQLPHMVVRRVELKCPIDKRVSFVPATQVDRRFGSVAAEHRPRAARQTNFRSQFDSVLGRLKGASEYRPRWFSESE